MGGEGRNRETRREIGESRTEGSKGAGRGERGGRWHPVNNVDASQRSLGCSRGKVLTPPPEALTRPHTRLLQPPSPLPPLTHTPFPFNHHKYSTHQCPSIFTTITPTPAPLLPLVAPSIPHKQQLSHAPPQPPPPNFPKPSPQQDYTDAPNRIDWTRLYLIPLISAVSLGWWPTADPQPSLLLPPCVRRAVTSHRVTASRLKARGY